MEDTYIIPANTKKSKYIFGLFRGIDLIIFGIGAFLTLLLLLVIPYDTALTLFLKLAPAGVAAFLVMPVPNYHNVLTLLIEIKDFFFNRRVYLWKGWCISDEHESE